MVEKGVLYQEEAITFSSQLKMEGNANPLPEKVVKSNPTGKGR